MCFITKQKIKFINEIKSKQNILLFGLHFIEYLYWEKGGKILKEVEILSK